MACDVQTLENLLTSDGFAALSDHDFLICLAGAFLGISNLDAQAAVTAAAANGYQKLSDLELDQALLAVFTASAFDAQSLVTTMATQQTDSLDRRDLLLAQVAAFCAGSMTTAASIEALLCSNGYHAFCQFDALRALLAVCSPSPLIGALDWSARVVQNGGAPPSAGTVTAISTFLTSISSIRSKIYHLNVFAPDSIAAMRTPLIKDYGFGVWVPHIIGAGFAETIGVNGWRGYADPSNGIVYDTGVIPSAIPSFTIANGGMSVCCPDVAPTATNNPIAGSNVVASFTGIGLVPNSGTGNFSRGAVWDTNVASQVSVVTLGGAFFSVNRVSNNNMSFYYGTSAIAYALIGTSAVVNASAPIGIVQACGGSNSGSGFVLAPQGVSCLAFHDGLTLAEGTILFNAVKALRTSFGGGFV